jgi:Tfp pilus assembly protein PilO
MNKYRDLAVKFARKPQTIIVIAVLAGILMNLGIFSYQLIPQLADWHKARTQEETILQLKKATEDKPLPKKAEDADIAALIKQVPTKDELPRFILDLKDIEKRTGVTMSSITFGAGGSGGSEMTGLLQVISQAPAAPGAQPNSAGSSPSGPSAVNPAPTGAKQTPAAGKAPAAAPAITELPISLSISGTYAQGTKFIRQLEQMDRIVNVKQWQMSPSGKAMDKENEGESADAVKLTFSLTCSFFTAKGYLDKFGDLPDIPIPVSAGRLDPTIADDQYSQLLQNPSHPQ